MVKLIIYQWWLPSLGLTKGTQRGKLSSHPVYTPPGQWKVLELEFYTSEFCVQDPELVDSKIYGLPLAMQGVCVCVFSVFFCEQIFVLGSKPIYVYIYIYIIEI